jgi:FixJ family two-component response regulator
MSTRQQIVVVEDDPSVVRSLQRLLRAAAFHVMTFSSAEKLLQSGFAGFVFDIHLPGLSGIELQRRLIERGIVRPVIFITAHDEPGMREAAADSGAVDCLLKPFPGSCLLDSIDKALNGPINSSRKHDKYW